ncbi:hypothetical protein [Streptomyces sp. NBC_00370]|uniref:hypothetical protein n=1 Tax=Streptomyces sp. NBC_00370 TaxID=2975728 RepID=UPI002E260F64
MDGTRTATRSTAAMLLLGMTMTAVSGCVSVTARPAAVPAPRSETDGHPHTRVQPQIVQPPAREALEAVAPAPTPSGPARPAAPTPPAGSGGGAPLPAAQAPPRHPPVHPPKHRTPAPSPAPRAGPAGPPVPAAGSQLCALGKAYGHWPAGSPQARICDQAYG